MQSIHDLLDRALTQIGQTDSLAALEQARVQYLGKSGELTAQMKLLGGLPPEERKSFGQAVNTSKARLEEALKSAGSRYRTPQNPPRQRST